MRFRILLKTVPVWGLMVASLCSRSDIESNSPVEAIRRLRDKTVIMATVDPERELLEGWASFVVVKVLLGKLESGRVELYVGDYLDKSAEAESRFYLAIQQRGFYWMPKYNLVDEESKKLPPLDGDETGDGKYYVIRHPDSGPYLFRSTELMDKVMESVLSPDLPEIDRRLLWKAIQEEKGLNRLFCESEFSRYDRWQRRDFDEMARMFSDGDRLFVKRIVESSDYSSLLRNYMYIFVMLDHSRFDAEWLLGLVRSRLDGGYSTEVGTNVIIQYGTVEDIDRALSVCLRNRQYDGFLASAKILVAIRPDQAKELIQKQLQNPLLPHEYGSSLRRMLKELDEPGAAPVVPDRQRR